jgi:N-acetylglucosaminyldiphosphoundecaprenol N-acetyl-beta-D-mannosaminyltransferase
MGKADIFGVKFDDLTMDEALEEIKGFVVLLYSEFIIRAQKDQEFKNILNSADFCLCEGKGLYLIAKFMGKSLKSNINGVELIYNFVKNSKFQIPNSKFFLYGGREDVVKKVADKLGEPVIGFEHGYQDEKRIIDKINLVKPDVLLVGLGSPKQEKFIHENLKNMPSLKLAIGVGGAFDFISGRVRRAPRFMQKTGLEWLWRLILEPKRVKRIYNGVFKLGFLAIKEKFSS